jgi:PPOX class probable F420-dependent enzyme
VGTGLRDTARVPTIDDPGELRRRVAAAPVARLATVRPDGSPRLVPITFTLLGELLCFAVDEVKPKRDVRLARLDDIARDPRVTVLVDHYDADWTTLWWVRIDGTAVAHADGTRRERALDVLAAKYPPYRAARPAGPVVIVTPGRWTGWSAR